MWRRLQIASSSLRRSALHNLRGSRYTRPTSCASAAAAVSAAARVSILPTSSSRFFSAAAETVPVTKTVEDVMPIATGHEREEIEAELQGKKRFDMDAPSGPFGTKEAPAVIQSYYNKRIAGCPGGEGEDEHDVVWFWLEKDKPHECPVCSQYCVGSNWCRRSSRWTWRQ